MPVQRASAAITLSASHNITTPSESINNQQSPSTPIITTTATTSTITDTSVPGG
jgi:hypothetical protein